MLRLQFYRNARMFELSTLGAGNAFFDGLGSQFMICLVFNPNNRNTIRQFRGFTSCAFITRPFFNVHIKSCKIFNRE